jgi:endonuclease/exonuclease/phosphatase family metal-dependent hydrolase
MIKKSYRVVLTFALLFLFLIQMMGTLVESIYILDLLNTALDEKVLGLLFFFTPLILLLWRKQTPKWMLWLALGLLTVSRGIAPTLDTAGRMLASGMATGAALILLPILLTGKAKGEETPSGWQVSAGLALGTGFSVLLRTVNFTIDYSLTTTGSWAGWVLVLLLGWLVFQLKWEIPAAQPAKPKGVTAATFGVVLVLAMVYFVFAAPGVLARWTEGNYALIVSTVSLLALVWVVLALIRPGWLDKRSPGALLGWNLLFTLALTGTILAHRVPFPPTQDAAAVVIGGPNWIQQIPLVLTLLSFPVIFLDLRGFARTLRQAESSPGALVPGLLLGSLALVLLVFMLIFTNVWGYVEPVSLFFRNKFWLPFLLLAGSLMLLGLGHTRKTEATPKRVGASLHWGWILLLGGTLLLTAGFAFRSGRPNQNSVEKSALTMMTYNIQQANDVFGEKSYLRQLAMIARVDPDLLALQESDSARISLNNNDYVRYFAGKLGYYSYYGPKTVAGTYGTAILSKYPLENPRTVFSFSDQDEVGTAEAEIEVGGRRFTIYDVHPDGSDTAMLAFAETLLARAQDQANVIALGDYNLRDYEEAYQLIDAVYTNAWVSVFPTEISDDGVDMSGENRIDHIFVSPHLGVRNPVYVLPPESATDHPVHWAEITWEE